MTTVPPGACNCCTDCSGELLIGDPAVAPVNFHVQFDVSGAPTGGFYSTTISVGITNYTATINVGDNQAAVQAAYEAALTPLAGATCVIVGNWESHTFEATGAIGGISGVNGFVDDFSGLTGGTDPSVDYSNIVFGHPGSDGDAETMHRLAWCVKDLSSLWEMPNQRGQNVVIPSLAGRRPRVRRTDETDYALPFVVSGVVDRNGDLNDDEDEGLRENLLYLRSAVFDPGDDATRPAQLVSPDGLTTLTADIQVMPLVRSAKYAGLWLGTLHIVIPSGGFA